MGVMRTYLKGLLASLLIAASGVLFSQTAVATDYYVRPLGGTYGAEDGSTYNDAYDGFADIVWATVDAGNGTLWVAGTHREQLVVGESGEVGVPIVIKSYAADPAILLGSVDKDSAWVSEGGNLYYVESITTDIGAVFYNTNATIGYGNKEATKVACDANWDFWWDDPNDRLYVYLDSGTPNGIANGLEVATNAVGSTIVEINNYDYITIDGLTLKYFNSHGIHSMDSDNIIVQNCTVMYGGGYSNAGNRQGVGITTDNDGASITFQNNTISQVYDSCLGVETFNADAETINGVTITGNVCSNTNWGVILYIEDDGTDDTITSATISNNTISSIGSVHGLTRNTTASGIYLYNADLSSTMSSITVQNNVIDTSTLYGMYVFQTDGTTNITKNVFKSITSNGIFCQTDTNTDITYNLIYDVSDNGILLLTSNTAEVYNNTIESDGRRTTDFEACLKVRENSTPVTAKNNIFYSTGTNDGDTAYGLFVSSTGTTTMTMNYNLYYTDNGNVIYYKGTGYATAAALYAAVSQEQYGVTSDPLFHTAGSNFHLTSTSPAISAGVTVGLSTDFDGVAVPQGGYDIGAFEYINWALRGATLNGALLP